MSGSDCVASRCITYLPNLSDETGRGGKQGEFERTSSFALRKETKPSDNNEEVGCSVHSNPRACHGAWLVCATESFSKIDIRAQIGNGVGQALARVELTNRSDRDGSRDIGDRGEEADMNSVIDVQYNMLPRISLPPRPACRPDTPTAASTVRLTVMVLCCVALRCVALRCVASQLISPRLGHIIVLCSARTLGWYKRHAVTTTEPS